MMSLNKLTAILEDLSSVGCWMTTSIAVANHVFYNAIW